MAVAHGQMDEGSLEQVVIDFWERRYDVLVCTTIIESGIDMPTVNTLVVDRADLLGLGQLHQLRGRVGRADQRAYAYLFHPADRVLTEQAYERLRTIGEHTELGLGVQDRHARPRDPRRGQPARLGPVRAHRRRRVRPLRPAGGRGGGRGQGRGPPRAAVGVPRRAGRRPPAGRLRGGRGRPPRGLPPTGGRHDPRRWPTWPTSGSTGSGRCRRAAEGLLALARLRVECLRTGVTDVRWSRPAWAGPGARRPGSRRSPCWPVPRSACAGSPATPPARGAAPAGGRPAREGAAGRLSASLLAELVPADPGSATADRGAAKPAGSMPGA